jgi:hypothetical protein
MPRVVKKSKILPIPTSMKKTSQQFDEKPVDELCTLSPTPIYESDSDSDCKAIDTILCGVCNKSIKKSYLSRHNKTKTHVNKSV